jgi:hypothetical protein
MVTHLTTNPPVKGLSCGERTGSGAALYLWSYVKEFLRWKVDECGQHWLALEVYISVAVNSTTADACEVLPPGHACGGA